MKQSLKAILVLHECIVSDYGNPDDGILFVEHPLLKRFLVEKASRNNYKFTSVETPPVWKTLTFRSLRQISTFLNCCNDTNALLASDSVKQIAKYFEGIEKIEFKVN